LRALKVIHALVNRTNPSNRGEILAGRRCPMSRGQRAAQAQNCIGFTAAITIYASSARSAAGARNFGAAMIQMGTVSAGGPLTKFNE